jgi:hypothetical protein
MYDLPSYVWVLVLTGVIGIPAVTCIMLYRGAVTAGLGRRAATTVTAVAGALSGAWILINGVLAGAGVYRQVSGRRRSG